MEKSGCYPVGLAQGAKMTPGNVKQQKKDPKQKQKVCFSGVHSVLCRGAGQPQWEPHILLLISCFSFVWEEEWTNESGIKYSSFYCVCLLLEGRICLKVLKIYLASTGLCSPSSERNEWQVWLYVVSSIVWGSWVVKWNNSSFTFIAFSHAHTHTHTDLGEGFEIALSCVFNNTDFPTKVFCTILKDTWFIAEYFLVAVSYRVIGAIIKYVTCSQQRFTM